MFARHTVIGNVGIIYLAMTLLRGEAIQALVVLRVIGYFVSFRKRTEQQLRIALHIHSHIEEGRPDTESFQRSEDVCTASNMRAVIERQGDFRQSRVSTL